LRSLEIIMPVYNEAASIEETVRKIKTEILDKIPGSRLMVIDDGSSDGTEKILDQLAREFREVISVFHQPNRGHGPAIYSGMEKAKAEWLFLLDSDNQIELLDFYKLWEKKEQADLLLGKRVNRHDPWVRIYLSKIIRYFLRFFLGVSLYDANVPFKLFKSSLWDEVKRFIPPDTLAPSLFLAAAAKKFGYRILEVEVKHYPRRAGKSSLKKWKLFKFCLKAFGQLLSFRQAVRFLSNIRQEVISFAGVKVDNITLKEAVKRIEEFLSSSRNHLVVTPNPEIIVACQKDQQLKEIINSSDLRVPDGISMVVVSRILGHPLKERVTGIDLMLKIVELSSVKGYKIFLLGGDLGVAEAAAQKLRAQYPSLNIVGTHHGYFGCDEEVVKAIKEARPHILFAGLGGGRQEKWLHRHLKKLNVSVAMGVGGSLDVISGRKKRAPRWVQNLYLEWLYRLITEPSRWKRQLALPKFLWLVFTNRF